MVIFWVLPSQPTLAPRFSATNLIGIMVRPSCLERGELNKAEEVLRRAFKTEPYDENVCLELLKLYMSQGRRSKAVKLYYSFKKRLEQDLNIEVDRRLTEAIRDPGSGPEKRPLCPGFISYPYHRLFLFP